MKSIKYLLLSIIALLCYGSDFPDTFSEMNKIDYIFLIGFAIPFHIGFYYTVKSRIRKNNR